MLTPQISKSTNHCEPQIRGHIQDSSCMREIWLQKGKEKTGETKPARECELPDVVENRATYKFHGSRGYNIQKSVSVCTCVCALGRVAHIENKQQFCIHKRNKWARGISVFGGRRCYKYPPTPLVLSFPLQLDRGSGGKETITEEILNLNSGPASGLGAPLCRHACNKTHCLIL